jgi:signal transduction histidine kinase
MRSPSHFFTRLLLLLGAVVGVVTLTWIATAELAQNGPFAVPAAGSLVVAAATSVVAAGIASWFLARRVARPIEALADAAEAVASGTYSVEIPDTGVSIELQRLSDAFRRMSGRLSDTEASRIRLLSDLAHEIRTPLATLEAYIDGLEDGVVLPDAASWSTMRDQVSRLRRLTADLRETAAAEEHALNLKLEDTDLAEVVVAAAEAVIPRSRAKGIEVSTTGTDVPAVVRVDADRLKQVLANLLDNALRHTHEGGHVSLAVTTEARFAVIRVTDDGDGIPRDQLETVFARFHRVDTSRRSGDGSGSGLGLTIARAIVSDHGGTVTAQSAGAGQGASFTIRLPMAGAATQTSPAHAPASRRRGTLGTRDSVT